MVWKENLFQNLLAASIILTIAIIVYCRVKGITLPEFFSEIKELFAPTEVITSGG